MMLNDPTASVERPEFSILVPGNGEAVMTPPPPPPGYELISAVLAVASAELSGYWACLAYHQQRGAYGLLIYWQRSDIHTFYPTDNASHLLCLYGAEFASGLDQDVLDGNGTWWAMNDQREVHDAME